jgi:CheY-like chemotaxis protein
MKRILIVEDNELNRDVLSRRLRRHGYEVLIATAGLEGLRLACASAASSTSCARSASSWASTTSARATPR